MHPELNVINLDSVPGRVNEETDGGPEAAGSPHIWKEQKNQKQALVHAGEI